MNQIVTLIVQRNENWEPSNIPDHTQVTYHNRKYLLKEANNWKLLNKEKHIKYTFQEVGACQTCYCLSLMEKVTETWRSLHWNSKKRAEWSKRDRIAVDYLIWISFFFLCLGFVSQTFTSHRTVREGGGLSINSSLPLPPALQTLRH